jgi:hypothetical protein
VLSLDPSVTFTPGAAYELRVLRSGPPDALNAYRLELDRAGMRTDGQLTTWDGAAWQPIEGSGSLLFKLEALEDTLAQVRRMLVASAGGQFLEGYTIPEASGLLAPLWREGTRTSRQEVEILLQLGSASDRRYLANVGADRIVNIWEAPLPGEADYALKPGGSLLDPYGVPVPPGHCPAGVWVSGQNLPEMEVGATRAFIEHCEWDETKNQLLLR